MIKKTHCHKYSDTALSISWKHLWQQLQPPVFLGVMTQALRSWIWGCSSILPNRSAQALSSSDLGLYTILPLSFGGSSVHLGFHSLFVSPASMDSCVCVQMRSNQLKLLQVDSNKGGETCQRSSRSSVIDRFSRHYVKM